MIRSGIGNQFDNRFRHKKLKTAPPFSYHENPLQHLIFHQKSIKLFL